MAKKKKDNYGKPPKGTIPINFEVEGTKFQMWSVNVNTNNVIIRNMETGKDYNMDYCKLKTKLKIHGVI